MIFKAVWLMLDTGINAGYVLQCLEVITHTQSAGFYACCTEQASGELIYNIDEAFWTGFIAEK